MSIKPKMTDEQVTKLAHDIVTNQVFMSDQCRKPRDLPMIFMALALVGPDITEQYKKEGIVHLYEYYSQAGPRGINGYTCFFSHYGINKPDYERVLAEELRMRKALGEPCQAMSDSSAKSTHQDPTQSGPTKIRPSSKVSGSRKPSKRTKK